LENEKLNHCPFLRRLAAIFYDCLLITAVLFAATFALMPLNNGEAIESGNWFYKVFLLSLTYFYFCWHWVKGGQTLGMRSWHVFVKNELNTNPDWKQASLRFFASFLSLLPAGLGFVWSLFDQNNLALHDHLSKTKLVVNKDKL
jgi:uncharacterized RDD family membrane protein YckC